MKKYLLLALFFGAFVAEAQNVPANLQSAYRKGFVVKSTDSVKYQKAFFDAFPANFKSFNDVYGWNKVTDKPNPLYHVSNEHITRLFALKAVKNDELIKKITGIAVNGVWEADAIGYFQHNLNNYAKSNSKNFSTALKSFSAKDITSVWAFLFDYENRAARKESYEQLVKLPDYKSMSALIQGGYKIAIKRNASH